MNLIPKNDVIHTNRNKNSGWYMISVDEYHGKTLQEFTNNYTQYDINSCYYVFF